MAFAASTTGRYISLYSLCPSYPKYLKFTKRQIYKNVKAIHINIRIDHMLVELRILYMYSVKKIYSRQKLSKAENTYNFCTVFDVFD